MLLVAAVGCQRHAPAAASAAANTRAPAATLAPANPTAPAPAASDLVVSGANGTWLLGADGQPQRRLSATPASDPRWLPGHQALLFLATQYRGRSREVVRELRRIGLAGGDERVVAALAPLPVCKAGRLRRLVTQHPDDFLVDAAGAVACLQLGDRELQLADTTVSLRIDLASGAVARRAVLTPDCDLVDGLPPGDAFHCDDPLPPPVDDFPGLPRPDEWDIRAVSPSRRWVVLQGNEIDVAAPRFDALLLDAHSQQLYPLVAGAWPAPIDPRRFPLDRMRGRTANIGDASDVRWLDGDRLVVDDLLVWCGRRSQRLAGQLIR